MSKPLLFGYCYTISCSIKQRVKDGVSAIKGISFSEEARRGEAPWKTMIPLPLDKEKRIISVRVSNGVKGKGLLIPGA